MFTVEVDTAQWLSFLDDMRSNQIPFALKNALNATATDFQLVQRVHMHEEFTVRQETWLDRSVKITHFATKAEQWATIAIQPPGSEGGTGAVLSKFETDTEKLPRGATLAVPIDARRNKRDIIPLSQRPRAFHFQQLGNKIVGDRRTFIVKRPDGSGVILQRVGSGKRAAVIVLYALRKRVPLKPDLHFELNAMRVVEARFDVNMDRALDVAMKTAK